MSSKKIVLPCPKDEEDFIVSFHSPKKFIDSDLLIFRLRKYIAASEELRSLHKGDNERIWKCKIFEQAYRNIISEIQSMKGEIVDGS